MANDLLGGLGGLGALGGLAKGLSGLMPQDDPNVKLFNAQSDLADLQKQKEAIFAEIGSKIYEQDGAASFPVEAEKLKLIDSNIAAAEEKLGVAQKAQESAESEKQQADEARTCPSCGHYNSEGIKFCQECGSKLGAPENAVCPSCQASNPPGTRFCGECGSKISD